MYKKLTFKKLTFKKRTYKKRTYKKKELIPRGQQQFGECLLSQQLCLHNVSVVNDYGDTQFSKISNYRLCYFYHYFLINFSKVR